MIQSTKPRYEDFYQLNRQMFIRCWLRDKKFATNSEYITSIHFKDRYAIIRAAMDIEGVDFVLSTMLKENWRKTDRQLVCDAWCYKIRKVG